MLLRCPAVMCPIRCVNLSAHLSPPTGAGEHQPATTSGTSPSTATASSRSAATHPAESAPGASPSWPAQTHGSRRPQEAAHSLPETSSVSWRAGRGELVRSLRRRGLRLRYSEAWCRAVCASPLDRVSDTLQIARARRHPGCLVAVRKLTNIIRHSSRSSRMLTLSARPSGTPEYGVSGAGASLHIGADGSPIGTSVAANQRTVFIAAEAHADRQGVADVAWAHGIGGRNDSQQATRIGRCQTHSWVSVVQPGTRSGNRPARTVPRSAGPPAPGTARDRPSPSLKRLPSESPACPGSHWKAAEGLPVRWSAVSTAVPALLNTSGQP